MTFVEQGQEVGVCDKCRKQNEAVPEECKAQFIVPRVRFMKMTDASINIPVLFLCKPRCHTQKKLSLVMILKDIAFQNRQFKFDCANELRFRLFTGQNIANITNETTSSTSATTPKKRGKKKKSHNTDTDSSIEEYCEGKENDVPRRKKQKR